LEQANIPVPISFSLGLKEAAFNTIPRIQALINPERSATPTPKKCNKNHSERGKIGKIGHKVFDDHPKPSAFNRLTGSMIPSGARPGAPSGLGSAAVQFSHSATPLIKQRRQQILQKA
jgi:hypothetical protein